MTLAPHPYIGWARPQTFDDERSIRRQCGCGHHFITGAPRTLYCPWKAEPQPARYGARWSQPEQETLSE